MSLYLQEIYTYIYAEISSEELYIELYYNLPQGMIVRVSMQEMVSLLHRLAKLYNKVNKCCCRKKYRSKTKTYLRRTSDEIHWIVVISFFQYDSEFVLAAIFGVFVRIVVHFLNNDLINFFKYRKITSLHSSDIKLSMISSSTRFFSIFFCHLDLPSNVLP